MGLHSSKCDIKRAGPKTSDLENSLPCFSVHSCTCSMTAFDLNISSLVQSVIELRVSRFIISSYTDVSQARALQLVLFG
jgi:hypothetical protein